MIVKNSQPLLYAYGGHEHCGIEVDCLAVSQQQVVKDGGCRPAVAAELGQVHSRRRLADDETGQRPAQDGPGYALREEIKKCCHISLLWWLLPGLLWHAEQRERAADRQPPLQPKLISPLVHSGKAAASEPLQTVLDFGVDL